MPSSNKEDQGVPLIIFVPVLLCIFGILVLLDIRQRRNHAPINNAAPPPPTYNTHQQPMDDLEDLDDSDDSPGEGTSTAVRVKKVGKKRGEKLRRKEEMRRYREYMDQQRELRRAQDEIYEEEFRRKKIEDSIKRTDEMEKRRKEKEKKAKQEAKEELKKQKAQEKEESKRQSRFKKYSDKVKKWVKGNKMCDIAQLAKAMGLSSEDVVDILKQLCDMDDEFSLCLWSGTDTFLFITPQDYANFNQQLEEKGKISIHDASLE